MKHDDRSETGPGPDVVAGNNLGPIEKPFNPNDTVVFDATFLQPSSSLEVYRELLSDPQKTAELMQVVRSDAEKIANRVFYEGNNLGEEKSFPAYPERGIKRDVTYSGVTCERGRAALISKFILGLDALEQIKQDLPEAYAKLNEPDWSLVEMNKLEHKLEKALYALVDIRREMSRFLDSGSTYRGDASLHVPLMFEALVLEGEQKLNSFCDERKSQDVEVLNRVHGWSGVREFFDRYGTLEGRRQYTYREMGARVESYLESGAEKDLLRVSNAGALNLRNKVKELYEQSIEDDTVPYGE